MPINLVNSLEPEWDLPSSLPLGPVFEEGVNIFKMNVIILIKSDTPQQVLGKDEVALGLFCNSFMFTARLSKAAAEWNDLS